MAEKLNECEQCKGAETDNAFSFEIKTNQAEDFYYARYEPFGGCFAINYCPFCGRKLQGYGEWSKTEAGKKYAVALNKFFNRKPKGDNI